MDNVLLLQTVPLESKEDASRVSPYAHARGQELVAKRMMRSNGFLEGLPRWKDISADSAMDYTERG